MATLQHYVLQSIVHSIVAVLMAEALLRLWRLRQPAYQLRFHILVLALPVLEVPLYHLVYPERGSPAFLHHALLGLEGWRTISVGGWHPVVTGLTFLVVVTTLLFLVQEALPALALYRRHRKWRLRLPDDEERARLGVALSGLGHLDSLFLVRVVDARAPLAYVQGLLNPSLVLSSAALGLLAPRELAGVLAHELAHLRRRDNWWASLILTFRAAMFFNPVALLVFRRILHDTERVCDEQAASLTTGDRLALASSLLKMAHPEAGTSGAGRPAWVLAPLATLEDRSIQAILIDRVQRLLHPAPASESRLVNLRLAAATLAIVTILFFVV